MLTTPDAPTRRPRLQTIPGWAMLAVAAAIAVAWLAWWGWHTHIFSNDEDQYVYLSRWFPQHLPESIWNFDIYQRGLQRFEIWLLAIPALVLDSPWSLAAGRLLNTVAFVSTAIPVYLLGRELELSSRWAAVPAALSFIVPWSVLTTSFLTENLAYPASMWAVWAIWRTAFAPSARRDLAALVLLLVCGLCRTGLLVMAPVLPIAILLTDLRFLAGGWSDRIRASLRSHALVWIAVAVPVLASLLGALGIGPGLTGLAGRYGGTPLGVDVVAFVDKIAHFMSREVLGTGFLPAAVGAPWLVAQLVRPADRRRYAFAVTVAAAAAILTYSLATAGFDERYIVYFAPLIFLTAAMAVARREVSPWGVAVTSMLLAVLLLRVPWTHDPNGYAFFFWPVETFFSRGLAERLDPYVPGGPNTILTALWILIGAIGVALAVALRRWPDRLHGVAGATLVALVALAVLGQSFYSIVKFVNGAGNRFGPGLRERAWVDQATPSGASIGEFAEGVGALPEFFPIWQEVQFYNQRIDSLYALGGATPAVPIGDKYVLGVSFDPQTGRLRSPRPLPDYLAIPLQVGTARVRGTLIKAPAYTPVGLIKIARPATLSWSAQGVGADGTIPAGGAIVRVFGTDLRPGRHCATLDFLGATGRPSRWGVRDGSRRAGAGSLAPAQAARMTYRVPDLVRRGFADLAIRGTGGPRLVGASVDEQPC